MFSWLRSPSQQKTETLKEELLNSLRESDLVKGREFKLTNITVHKEAITIISHY